MEVLSAVIVIAQSDMKYLMKVNLEQLFYESSRGSMILFQRLLFSRTAIFWKKLFFFFEKPFLSLLPFVTIVNYERAYLVEIVLHILCSYFNVALAQL